MSCTTIYISTLDIFFSSNHNIHKSLRGLLFWASDLLIDRFSKSLSINGTEAQFKGHVKFYECCDLTKKVYLMYIYTMKKSWSYAEHKTDANICKAQLHRNSST